MKFTIVLSSHRKQAFVAEAIDSVLQQTLTDWECVLFDSGVLFDRGRFSSLLDPRFVVVRSDETPEMRWQKNMASWVYNECHRRGLIRGELVRYLCDDDLLHQQALEAAAQFFDDNPDALAAAGTVEHQWGSGTRLTLDAPTRTGFRGRFDYLQLSVRRELLDRVEWPEGAEYRSHADAEFAERIGKLTPVVPFSAPMGKNRRTIQSLSGNPNMSQRPCVCDQTRTCRLCWLYHNDDRYHKMWGGDDTGRHRGFFTLGTTFAVAFVKHAASGFAKPSDAEIERRQQHCNRCPFHQAGKCTKCGCNTSLKALWQTSQCPVSRWERKTLLYHVYPRNHNGMWQWNVDEVNKRIDLFDRIIVSVATDDRCPCDPPEEVFARFRRPVERLVVRNGPLQEMESWQGLWQAAKGETGFVMYAHAKGVSKHAAFPAEKFWASLMWETLTDYWSAARQLLHSNKIVGSLKRGGGVHPGSHWHYPGSFYWVRAEDGLERWILAAKSWIGTEGWPGVAFSTSEAGNLFDVYGSNHFNFYDGAFMAEVSKSTLPDWKAANAAHRSI